MKRRFIQLSLTFSVLLIITSCSDATKTDKPTKKPNVVIIFLDDSGYSDFNPFGQVEIETPNVQKLADIHVV